MNDSSMEGTFNTVADAYEKIRPGYPDELYRMIFDYCPVGSGSLAAEVGIGGGQATLPVLETGCAVTAVEYGEQLAQICREKFRAFPGFSAMTGRFEEAVLPEGTFDLVYSASAFHWIPEEIGYPKVFRMLKSGGAFARFANHPYRARNDPELFEKISRVYAEYYYAYYKEKTQPAKYPEYTEEQAADRAKIAGKYRFTDIRYALFHRVRTLSAAEYRMLIGTYSDHIAMEENIREKFLDAIEDTIGRHGGMISVYDTIDLQLARKP